MSTLHNFSIVPSIARENIFTLNFRSCIHKIGETEKFPALFRKLSDQNHHTRNSKYSAENKEQFKAFCI